MSATQSGLDGNTAAGMLGEIFPFDMTTVSATCGGCGMIEPIGAETAYLDAPGLVLRCAHCQSVMLRMVRAPTRAWLDLQGVRCLEIRFE